MPFTFSHPAAVIPLHRVLRRHTVLSALIIGSMAPDFQNFLPFDVDRSDSHSLAGMLWFCLPLGLLLYLAFHLLLKMPLLGLLPPALAARLGGQQRQAPLLPRASGLAIVMSLLIGTATHLAWDALTHYSWVTVFVLAPLSNYLFSMGDYHVYPYKLLQHASTVAGALLLWHWSRRWLAHAPAPMPTAPATLASRERHTVIGILLAAPPAIGLALAAQSYAASYGLMDRKDFVREVVTTGISSFGLLLLAYSVVWHAFLWQRGAPRNSP